jgi:hypothetical protein
VIEGPQLGRSSALIITLVAVAIVSVAALVLVEPRRREPLIDVRYFRSTPFSGATLIAVVALVANAGFLFLNTLYLREARGYSPLRSSRAARLRLGIGYRGADHRRGGRGRAAVSQLLPDDPIVQQVVIPTAFLSPL